MTANTPVSARHVAGAPPGRLRPQVTWVLTAIALLIGVRMWPSPFRNGSFESATGGWTVMGHVEIARADAAHPATDGSAVAVFNANDHTGVGSALTQRFRTTRGVRYDLAFDLGTVGAIADQSMRVTVRGRSILLDAMVVVAGLTADPFYVPQQLSFVADGLTASVTFADRSATYVGIDALLDNVHIVPSAPDAPVILNAPTSMAVAAGADARFRVVASGPPPLSYQWQFNGRDVADATGATLVVPAASIATAGNYTVVVSNAGGPTRSSAATLTVLPPALLLNGSFEYGSAAWTFVGPFATTSTNAGYGVTDGAELVHFNWGQAPPGGSVSQRVTTTPGQRYTLEFDVGAFSRVNRGEQRMRVSVQGHELLLARTIAVHAPGNGGRYRHQRDEFVADSTATTITFADMSTETRNVDLLLDDVQLATTRDASSR